MIHYNTIASSNDTKPWLTLVHGFSHNQNYFTDAIPFLTENYRLLLIDLRGHGGSSSLPGPFGITEYADDIEEVFEKEKISRSHYWGTHTGTGVGLVLVLKKPALFEKMVLEGAVLPGSKMNRTEELLARAAKLAKSHGLKVALDDWFEHTDWFSHIHKHPERANALSMKKLIDTFTGAPWLTDLQPRQVPAIKQQLNQISQKVLIYNGQHDLDEFKKVAGILEASLNNVSRKVIANTGGFPLWESPASVIQIVIDFLGGC